MVNVLIYVIWNTIIIFSWTHFLDTSHSVSAVSALLPFLPYILARQIYREEGVGDMTGSCEFEWSMKWNTDLKF